MVHRGRVVDRSKLGFKPRKLKFRGSSSGLPRWDKKYLGFQLRYNGEDFVYHGNSDTVLRGKDAYGKYTAALFKDIDEKCVEIKYFRRWVQGVVTAQRRAVGKFITSREGLPQQKSEFTTFCG